MARTQRVSETITYNPDIRAYTVTTAGGAYIGTTPHLAIAERWAEANGRPVWCPGMRYPYSHWPARDRQAEARLRRNEYRRFLRMTDGELAAQARRLVDTADYIWQDKVRLRCALSLAGRNGVDVWPTYYAA